jgi:hypothetical protein
MHEQVVSAGEVKVPHACTCISGCCRECCCCCVFCCRLQAPAGPLVVNGRAVGADEAAVCDLCDSDDEPSWQVQKKQAIDVGPEL